MYASCLFCNTHLGTNESIEHFPVGRRLAFDAAKGRLWVVCRNCERWNLTPIETRWEAIEDAERLFRATKMRVSTDNIGMAELREGTQLVRIGAPPPLEFAAWRYGDQFGKRRRTHLFWGSVMALAVAAQAASATRMFGTPESIAAAGAFVSIGYSLVSVRVLRRNANKFITAVRDERGALQPMTTDNARGMVLDPRVADGTWELFVPHGGPNAGWKHGAHLQGEAAMRALGTIIPHVNRDGGTSGTIRKAVSVIEDAPSVAAIVHAAARNKATQDRFGAPFGVSAVGSLPRPVRLALEMSLHQSDERRAMEGELVELEARWREADEIAAIADNLLAPAGAEQKLDNLRKSGG